MLSIIFIFDFKQVNEWSSVEESTVGMAGIIIIFLF
jgi:hypothetical protein